MVEALNIKCFFFCSSGEADKPCVLRLVDDLIHEDEEELRLVLGSAKSDSSYGASVGNQNETLIKIKDNSDSTKKHYSLTPDAFTDFKVSLLYLFPTPSSSCPRAHHQVCRDQVQR